MVSYICTICSKPVLSDTLHRSKLTAHQGQGCMNNTEVIVDTCYGPVARSVVQRARLIRLLLCDVDGVLSNGLIYMGSQGEELKAFHTRDGYGIVSLRTVGIDVGLITGRSSPLVANRAQALGITHVYQGQSDKLPALQELLDKLTLSAEQVAYIGDDLIDQPIMQRVGLAVAVADAHPLLLPHAHYVTKIAGGHGAVREICDLILLAQDHLTKAKGQPL